ncbi:hypothetical protein ACA910_004857 [Epithemia clementina (nom. ined.)]
MANGGLLNAVTMQQQEMNSYDPYGPTPPRTPRQATQQQQRALLDTAEESVFQANQIFQTNHVLEMEEDSISLPESPSSVDSRSRYNPVITSSGLLLTHRRAPPIQSASGQPPTSPPTSLNANFEGYKWAGGPANSPPMRSPPLQRTQLHRERFEVENPWSASGSDSVLSQIQKLFTYARVWVLLSSLVLLLGTIILLHHVRRPQENNTMGSQDFVASAASDAISLDATTTTTRPHSNVRVVQLGANYPAVETAPDQIILLPLDPSQVYAQSRLNSVSQSQSRFNKESQFHRHLHEGWQRKLHALRADFESWIVKHGKQYKSSEEVEYRFNIWTENHHRIMEKNDRHGPCKLTNQKVFGSNHFQDLTKQEFEDQFLNAKHIPLAKKLKKPKFASGTMGHHIAPIRHPDVHERYLKMTGQEHQHSQKRGKAKYKCDWYDVSCMVRWVVERYFYGFYGIGATMEPAYDKDTYPKSVDWRDVGAVTNVRSQDNCGACWAITAVECVESANFITYGTLYDLSEYEVILCVESSEMCYGGWPEDAFDFIMENGGVPLEKTLPYNGDFLLSLTQAVAGESSQMTAEDVEDYKASICPSDSGSHDSNDNGGGSGSGFARYGKIAGYGYATDRCVCYSDGSGCDCDNQNEGLAVANLATYGPAVVCVDASEWKDYTGGILTSAIGCSSAFLDVNHCIQAVGYAFHTDSDRGEGENSHSGDNSKSGSGSSDNSNRVGYWIVRNQWSEYWGMYGYAYVAMGDNTCGILNDMMQVYSKN